MKLSTKGRYAARLMLNFALYYGRGPVLLKEVAKEEEISEKYLGHLIPSLKAAGLINSTRGAHGGYNLSKPPQEITLAEVVQAVEGDLALVECVNFPQVCSRVNFCVTRDIWREISEKILEVLKSTTLLELVNCQRQRQKLQPLIYSI